MSLRFAWLTWGPTNMMRMSFALFLCFLCLASTRNAAAFEPPAYPAPQDAIDQMLEPLLDNDRELFLDVMTLHYDESGKQIESLVFDTFLLDDEVFVYSDVLLIEELGKTLKQYTYVLRTSSDDFLYMRIHSVQASRGWIAYDLDIKSDLTKFFPGWDDP